MTRTTLVFPVFLALLGGLLGCAPEMPEAYHKALAEGQRARTAGRYAEAAAAYERAADAAERLKDRDDAWFSVARAKEDAGDLAGAKAAYERIVAQSPDGPRTGRALFALAYFEIAHGDAEKGYKALWEALQKFPNHGNADRALKELADREEERGGLGARITWLASVQARFAATELDEVVVYELGLALRAAGRNEEARAQFVAAAEAHPHPFGGLTDDAWWHAAEIDRELGRPAQAIDDLRRMLAPRERSSMNGSYTRQRFPPGQMLIAEIYRDDLHDHAAARREFQRLFDDFPDSVLRDDALYQQALLARADGDLKGACGAAERLVDKLPDSRYAPCAHLLCKDLSPLPNRSCADYIVRELQPPNEASGGDAE